MENRKRILIIEDYLPLNENIQSFLTLSGFEVSSATNGAEGIQKALSYLPDLILCDIQMPYVDGYEVLSTLQKIPETSIIPFIFMTAKAQVEDIRIGLQLGVDDYITKPFPFDELLTSINKRLSKYENLLSANNEKFKILADSPLYGVFIISNDKLLFVNSRFAMLTGYEVEALNDISFSQLIRIDEREMFSELVNKCINGTKGILQTSLHIQLSNQQYSEIEIFAKPIKFKEKKALLGSMISVSNNEINSKLSEKVNDYFNNKPEELGKLFQLYLEDSSNIGDEFIKLAKEFEKSTFVKNKKLKDVIKLSEREIEILQLICDGFTNIEIAEKLFISPRTVDNHRAHLLEKTNTKNAAHLVAYAIKFKLI